MALGAKRRRVSLLLGVGPRGDETVLVGFVGKPGENVGVQPRLVVSEDLIVDAVSRSHGHKRLADQRHVEQEPGASVPVEIGEIGDHRVGQQDAVALQELRVAEDGPARRHLADQHRQFPVARQRDPFGNQHAETLLALFRALGVSPDRARVA